MVKSNDILKVMSIIPVTFFRKCNLLLSGREENLPVAELFLQNIFSGNPSREKTAIVMVMFGLLEITIFNLLFGLHIYHDLYENSIYIFVRQKSRKIWFAKKSVELLILSAIYNFLFIGITFLLCVLYSSQGVDFVAIKIVILTYILISLFTFWTTLLINIVAMLVGATVSFILNYIILTFFSVLAISFESIPVINQFPILLKLNPIANVTINWNDGIGRGIQPAVYFAVLCILTYIAGSILVSKIDISIESKE